MKWRRTIRSTNDDGTIRVFIDHTALECLLIIDNQLYPRYEKWSVAVVLTVWTCIHIIITENTGNYYLSFKYCLLQRTIRSTNDDGQLECSLVIDSQLYPRYEKWNVAVLTVWTCILIIITKNTGNNYLSFKYCLLQRTILCCNSIFSENWLR